MTAPQELAEAALGAAGVDGCVVVVEDHSAVNLRWAGNSMTTNGHATELAMTVVAVHERSAGRAIGIAARSLTTRAEAAELARAADAASRASEPIEDAPALVEPYAVQDDWIAEVPRASPRDLQQVVSELAVAFGRRRQNARALFGFAEQQRTTLFLATSTGLRRRFDQPDGRFELTGRSEALGQSAWHGRHVPDFSRFDVGAAVERLERDLLQAIPQVQLPPGRYETILPPAAVADLMVYAYSQASARDAREGRNVFAAPDGGDRIGERLAPLPLTLYSDPAEPGLDCPPFAIVTSGESTRESVFDNGEPLARTAWIDRGRLSDLVRTRSWATRTDDRPRPVIGNLILDGGGSASIEEMVARTERGLLLTSLWYIREVDPRNLLLTGLTRDGVYLIEHGAVRGAVNNFRFNESPIGLLGRAIEVGRTEHTLPRERADAFRRTAMPPLRIADFRMSSVSSAR